MINSDASPVFIVFEGLDGAGKTTCARALATAIRGQYMTTPAPEVRVVHAAVLNSFGECQEARQLFYLATVFAAERRVREALASGISVVMDRYFLSTQVYAEVRGSALDLDVLGNKLLAPAMTVFLDAPLATRQTRLAARSSTPADRETLTSKMDLLLRGIYLQKASLAIAGSFIVLANETGSAEEMVAKVLKEIETHGGSKICGIARLQGDLT